MSLLDIIYPPTCLNCNELQMSQETFCSKCLRDFTLLRKEGRCVKCFAEIAEISGTCKACRKMAHPFRALSSCFEAFGPAWSLYQGLTKQKQFHLAKDIAAYLAFQLHTLDWPIPDCIVGLPNSFQNPHYLAIREMAKMLDRPFLPLLKRHLCTTPTFSLKKRCKILNKVVLLIGMHMQTRANMRAAAWALDTDDPETLYGMTFCVT